MKRIKTILISISLLVGIWVLVQIFVFSSYKIPSYSMGPALISGDYILVNKMVQGARLFNLNKALNKNDFAVFRMPGYARIKRNDVIVFNYPYPNRRDSIEFDLMHFYVKRCIGLPGDTFYIKDARYYVNGFDGKLGCRRSQDRLAEKLKSPENTLSDELPLESYPYDSLLKWDIKDMGPLYIPRKNDEISMDVTNAVLYRYLIEWEEKKKVRIEGDSVFLGNRLINSYCFKSNYYFVAGDEVTDSEDSRYWGLLPEEFIAGVASRIWKSVNPFTGEWRWYRFMKKIE